MKDDVIDLWGDGKMLLRFGLDGSLRGVGLEGGEEIFQLVILWHYCTAVVCRTELD